MKSFFFFIILMYINNFICNFLEKSTKINKEWKDTIVLTLTLMYISYAIIFLLSLIIRYPTLNF